MIGFLKAKITLQTNPFFKESKVYDVTIHTNKIKIIKNTSQDAPNPRYSMFEIETKVPRELINVLNNYGLLIKILITDQKGNEIIKYSIINTKYQVIDADDKYQMIHVILYGVGELTYRLMNENSLNSVKLEQSTDILNFYFNNIEKVFQEQYGLTTSLQALPEFTNRTVISQLSIPQMKNNLEWLFEFFKHYNFVYPYDFIMIDEANKDGPQIYINELLSAAKQFGSSKASLKTLTNLTLIDLNNDFDPKRIKIISEANYIINAFGKYQIYIYKKSKIRKYDPVSKDYIDSNFNQPAPYYYEFQYLVPEIFLNRFRRAHTFVTNTDLNTYTLFANPYNFDIDIGSMFYLSKNDYEFLNAFVYSIQIELEKKVVTNLAGEKNLDNFNSRAYIKIIDLTTLIQQIQSTPI